MRLNRLIPQQIGVARIERSGGFELYVGDELVDAEDPRFARHYLDNLVPGDVLVVGLGLGLTIGRLLLREDVTSVKVIEKEADVISLVEPAVQNDKLTIVNEDVFEWTPEGEYDTIIVDIYPCTSQEVADLTATLTPLLKQDGWLGSWEGVS